MKLKFAFFALLIAATTANNEKGRDRDLSFRKDVRYRIVSANERPPRFNNRCKVKTTTRPCSSHGTTTPTPTTVPTTRDPTAGCEWCLDDELSVGDTFAGYCFPYPSESECYCLCADLFCFDGKIIDRSTCVNGGSLSDCRCIDVNPPTSPTTSSSPSPTTSSAPPDEYDY